MEEVTSVQPIGCKFSLKVPSRHREVYEVHGYERYSTVLFKASCSTSSTVIDIGAHMGYYSLLAREANAEATIVAVEASPENFQVLCENLEQAEPSSIRAVNAAFGNTQGTVVIQLTEASDNCGISGHPVSPTLSNCEVPAITGQQLDIVPGTVITVKLDVEGHEISALNGLETVLSASADARLFIEFNPKCLTAAGNDPDGLLAWLFDRDYRVFILDEHQCGWSELTATTPWSDRLDLASYANLYCVRRDSALTLGAVLHSAGIAGAERSHVDMVDLLVRHGALVHTVLPMGGSQVLRDMLFDAGSSVSEVEPYPWWMSAGPGVGEGEEETSRPRFLADAGVLAALGAVNPDVVLTQTGAVPQGAVGAAILGKPHVWYLREFGDADHGYVLPLAPMELGELFAALSAHVVTNSAAVRSHFFPEGADNVTVIHPSPRVDELSVTSADPARPVTVGVVGSLNEGKGHLDALEAVALLRATGLDVPVVFAGAGDDADIERLLDAARRLGVADLLTLAGTVSSRAHLYSLFDIVAVTSRSEAFGRVPFEATSAGLPVVYTEAGGVGEYMESGVTGTGYAVGDASALAQALRALIEDDGLKNGMVAGARERLCDPAIRERYVAALMGVLKAAAAVHAVTPTQALAGWIGFDAAESKRESEVRAEAYESLAAHAAANVSAMEAVTSQFEDLLADHERVTRAYAELWEEREAVQADLQRVNVAYADLWQDRERLDKTYSALAREQVDLQRSHGVLEARLASIKSTEEECERQREQIAALDGQTGALTQDCDALSQERDALKAHLDSVLGSRSWRYTSALRKVLAPVRRR